jgi:rhodanese-related sulfurtransferase
MFSPRPTPEVSVVIALTSEMGESYLLDVREPDEWAAGHAPEAHWIPLGDLETRRFELPMNKRVIAICRSGARSAKATDALIGWGFMAANFAGGMKAWAEADLPVVTDDGSPGTVI